MRTAGPKAPPKRVADELGFVLHAWPWRESSLVADVLSLRYGRVFLIAKGAKRQASPLRGLLVPFAPLRLAWAGRNEGKVLIKAEWMGTLAPLSGEALLSGFYMNEMLVKLTEREDPHPKLFGAYVEALHALGTASGCSGALNWRSSKTSAGGSPSPHRWRRRGATRRAAGRTPKLPGASPATCSARAHWSPSVGTTSRVRAKFFGMSL